MKPEDNVGRIHKEGFVISTAVLLALAILATIIRFIVRFGVQKLRFSLDDGFLLLALSCLIVCVVAVYTSVLDPVYYVTAMQNGVPGVTVHADIIQMSSQFHKWVTISNMAAWCAVMAVKFSFMFFFKKLIERIPVLNVYWYWVLVYQLACLGYGLAVYYIGCPFYFDIRELQCVSGRYKNLLVHHAAAQMSLDLVGDIMILVMPTCILWKIRVQWTQKLALTLSLCLTIFMMVTTIARVSGIIHHDKVDSIWGIYWAVISAEVGVFMAAATAFRSFFVARSTSRNEKSGKKEMRYFFAESFAARFRKKRNEYWETVNEGSAKDGLPNHIPRAQMTGLRSFIEEQGKTQTSTQTKSLNRSASNASVKDDYDIRDRNGDLVPLHTHGVFEQV